MAGKGVGCHGIVADQCPRRSGSDGLSGRPPGAVLVVHRHANATAPRESKRWIRPVGFRGQRTSQGARVAGPAWGDAWQNPRGRVPRTVAAGTHTAPEHEFRIVAPLRRHRETARRASEYPGTAGCTEPRIRGTGSADPR